jgi:hypothetical protein
MNDYASSRTMLILRLAAGVAGIAILWAGGVEFPLPVPPGLVVLAIGAVLAALVRRP